MGDANKTIRRIESTRILRLIYCKAVLIKRLAIAETIAGGR
jgi:hypothetical protein